MNQDQLFTDDRAWADPEQHGTGNLHALRMDAVLDELHRSGARSVVDLGCGAGALLLRLVEDPQFIRMAGFDIDGEAVANARARPALQAAVDAGRLALDVGSFLAPVLTKERFDAAVLLETIEHIDPARLSLVERSLLGVLQPSMLIMTTPNVEYNPLYGLSPGQLRHPDHRFEWTRSKFRAWVQGLALRNGYVVVVSGIGPADPQRGSSSQLAVFSR